MWGQDHPSSLLPPPPMEGGIITGTASSNYILGLIGMTKSHGPVGRVEKMHMCNMNSGIHTATNFNCLPLHYPIQNINSAIQNVTLQDDHFTKCRLYKTSTVQKVFLQNDHFTKCRLYKTSTGQNVFLQNDHFTKCRLYKTSTVQNVTLQNVHFTKCRL